MNRKLHNTVSALSVSGVLLALTLITAVPAPATRDVDTAQVAPAASPAAGTALGQAEPQPQPARRGGSAGKRSRHGLAMPYFSFAPRG